MTRGRCSGVRNDPGTDVQCEQTDTGSGLPGAEAPTPSGGGRSKGQGGERGRTGNSHQKPDTLPKLDAMDNRLPTVRMGFHRDSETSRKLYRGAIKLLSEAAGRRALPELMPHVEQAQAELDAHVGQIALAAGECGPIETTSVVGAAWQIAYGRYGMAKAAGAGDMQGALIASKLLDSGRAALMEALRTAVAIARSKPKDEPADVLDAYVVKK